MEKILCFQYILKYGVVRNEKAVEQIQIHQMRKVQKTALQDKCRVD